MEEFDRKYFEAFQRRGYVVKVTQGDVTKYFKHWNGIGNPIFVSSKQYAAKFTREDRARQLIKWLPIMRNTNEWYLKTSLIEVEMVRMTLKEYNKSKH